MSRLYPDLKNSIRRDSESFRMPKRMDNQIFAKNPALDILGKMQKGEIGPDTTYILGYQIKTRIFWVLSGLLLLFMVSFAGMVAMWFTDVYDNAIYSHLVLANDSSALEMFVRPSPKPLLKVHIFNYTNVFSYENYNAEKLNVEELGPYVYEVSLERVNLHYQGDKVTFQEKRHYKFMPELSKGRQNDRVIVPNLPMLGAAALNKHSNFITRVGLSGLLNGLNAKPFLSLPAHKFIVGYEDNLYTLSKSVLKMQNKKPYEHFGLMSSKIGLSNDILTVNTGAKDINKILTVYDKISHWSTDECNSLNGATDGSMFSPKKIRNKQPVYFYQKDFCRALMMEFQKEVKILNGKIPAYRYVLPDDIFDSAERNPQHQCYCNMDLGECPLQGVFNATPCAFGAPIFISFPHFYRGDSSLKEGVTGLRENVPHENYADIHPTLGFVMSAKTRMQLNIQVVKSFGISQLNRFDDGLILPVAWMDMSLEDKTLPDDVVGIIFQTTFTVKAIEMGLKFGTILMMIVTLASLLIVVSQKWRGRGRTSSIRPLQRREDSVE